LFLSEITFTRSKIHFEAEAISERLRSKRQELNLKLEKAAKETRINIKYLDALEKGRFELLPSGLYGKNYLREYATYLRLDSADLLELYDNEVSSSHQVRSGDLFNAQVVKRHYFLSFPKILRGILIVFFVLIAGIYLFFRLRGMISPPFLFIKQPQDNFITASSSVELLGRAEVETQIRINGQEVTTDAEGNFSKILGLQKGLNLITISAERKYGRKNSQERRILRQ
jgi:cytoskeletal protein RodZ